MECKYFVLDGTGDSGMTMLTAGGTGRLIVWEVPISEHIGTAMRFAVKVAAEHPMLLPMLYEVHIGSLIHLDFLQSICW